MCIHMYVCMYVCMYMYVCIYIYIHINVARPTDGRRKDGGGKGPVPIISIISMSLYYTTLYYDI